MTGAPSVTRTHCDSVRVRTSVPLPRTFVLDMKRRANYGWCLVVEYMWVRQTEFFYTRGGPPSLFLVVLDGVWSWNTCESGRQNSFTHVVVLQAYCWWWCYCSVAKSCPALCDPVDYSMPSSSVLHCLPEFAQTHVQWLSDAITVVVHTHSWECPHHKDHRPQVPDWMQHGAICWAVFPHSRQKSKSCPLWNFYFQRST